MSQPSSAVSSSVTDRRTLSGDAASYQSELADFTVFPGLKSFAQPLTAQSQPSLSGSTSQTSPQPQPQPQPDSSSSSGNSDIEKLERLKREILEGQNPIYRAIPQPRFLEKLYLGRSVQRQDFVPAHPDQITKSPPSSNPQVRLTDSAKAGETEPSAKLDSLQESSKAGAESTPATISKEPGKPIRESDTILPKETSPTPPKEEAKVTPFEARDLGSSSRQGSNDLKPSSAGLPDYPNQEKPTFSQPATLPGSHAMAFVAPPEARSLLNESLPADPPYDPKESLRHLENSSIWSDARYRPVGFPYNPNGSHFDYVHAPDSHNDEQGREREWGKNGYGYDDRPYGPDYYAGHSSTAPGTEPMDPAYRGYDDRHPLENRAGVGFERSTSSPSDGHFKAASEFLESVKDSIAGKAVNGKDNAQVAHSLVSPVRSASGDARLATGTYASPVDGSSRFVEHADFKSITEGRRQSSSNDKSNSYVAEASKPLALEDRISNHAPPPLKDRIGLQIPLEERISSPPGNDKASAFASLEKPDNRPRLEDRLSLNTGAGAAVSHVSGSTDVKSIPTPLSMLRSRGADGKLSPTVQVSQRTSAGQSFYQESSNYPQRGSVPQSRSSASGEGPETPPQGKPQDAFSYPRPSAVEDPDPKSASTYHGERRFADEGRPSIYERPAFRPREASGAEDRSRSIIEAREWRERNSYQKPSYPQRPDSNPPSSSPPKAWAPKARNGRQQQAPFAEGGARPPPRSWNRPDPGYTRPPPEVYTPPSDYAHDGYAAPPHDSRERPRVRGRSPSPVPARRSTYGGPAAEFRPAKRVRDEAFYDDREPRYSDYHPRAVQSSPGGYYDPRAPYPTRDAPDGYDAPYYDRRASDMGPPLEPPYTGRAVYPRPDPDMYNGAPPRTA